MSQKVFGTLITGALMSMIFGGIWAIGFIAGSTDTELEYNRGYDDGRYGTYRPDGVRYTREK